MNQSQLRRIAIQIAAQLPENTKDSEMVLEYASELVRGFLSQPDGNAPPRPKNSHLRVMRS